VVSSHGFTELLLGAQPVSSLSHLFAAAVALVAALPLVRLGRGCSIRVSALGIYAACVVLALAISGVYHSMTPGEASRVFMQRLDYYGIWLLIAGTFTAVHGVMHRGVWREGLLAFIWLYAFTGIFLQVMWFEQFNGRVGLFLYLGLGWIGVASIVKLGMQIGFRRVLPVVYAGVAFSAGALLEAFGRLVLIPHWVGGHEIFHFAVVLGVALNWLFIRTLLLHHLPAASGATGVTGVTGVTGGVK
jgi:hemolysin III